MAERVRAIRGATTLDSDSKEQVIERTSALLQAIFDRNALQKSDLISIVFTATGDISSEFPAAAARQIGISDIPLLCARELEVDGAVTLCVRVLIHAYTERALGELRHVYLERAQPLRTDLPQ